MYLLLETFDSDRAAYILVYKCFPNGLGSAVFPSARIPPLAIVVVYSSPLLRRRLRIPLSLLLLYRGTSFLPPAPRL